MIIDLESKEPIFLAAIQGDIVLLEKLKLSFVTDKLNAEGTNSSSFNKDEFQKLINSQDTNLASPLHYAAVSGQIQAIQWLIAAGAVISKDKLGANALFWAARAGSLKTVKFLLHSPDFTPTDKMLREETLLHISVLSGNLYLVKWLITNKYSQANESDTMGMTAYTLCSRGTKF